MVEYEQTNYCKLLNLISGAYKLYIDENTSPVVLGGICYRYHLLVVLLIKYHIHLTNSCFFQDNLGK